MKDSLNYILLFIFLAISIFFNIRLNNRISEIKNAKPVIFNTTDTIFNPIRMINPQENLTFIEATINGKKVIFLLDSGAGTTVMDKDQLSELGLLSVPLSEDGINGIGGTNTVYRVTNLSEIEINGKTYPIKAQASNISNVVTIIRDAVKFNIVGILGSDFFNQNEVIFDYKENLFIITKGND